MTDIESPEALPKEPKDRPLNPYRLPKSENVIALVKDVMGQMIVYEKHFELRKRKRRPSDQKRFEDMVTAIICDLIYASLCTPDKKLYVSLSKRIEDKIKRYSPASFGDTLPDLLKVLSSKELSFVDMRKGQQGYFGTARQTTIKAGKRLISRIELFDIEPSDLRQDINQESIILKKSKESFWDNGEWQDYIDNETTNQYRQQMRLINEWLIEDIQSNRLSHTNIGPDIWGDPAENPLLDKVFKDVASGEKIYLDSLVADLYGVSWSLAPVPTREAWSYFSYSSDSVRIQTTPRKLLEAAMELKNPYYMLQHFIGKVEYIEEKVFDSFFDDNNFSKYLDTNGHGLALSVMKLPNDASHEEEVRLVYFADRNHEWTKQNVVLNDNYAYIPFCWENVIENIVAGPMYKGLKRDELKLIFQSTDTCKNVNIDFQ